MTLLTRTKIRKSTNPMPSRTRPNVAMTPPRPEALKEEQDPDEDRNPAEPARQDTAPDHEQACCQSKQTAEDVSHAVQGKGHQVTGV